MSKLTIQIWEFILSMSLISVDPTSGIEFLPVVKKKKYVPPKFDVLKVIGCADPDTQDYLWSILLTGARVGEINALNWEDVSFDDKFVTLWTRKKKGGNQEPRDIPMVSKLYDILKYRYDNRNNDIPWVFWHNYWSRKEGRRVNGPYGDRKKIMKTLCNKAEVKYFRFHPLRHLTASILDDLGVPIGVIQRILGHENRRTTEMYLYSVGEAERKAMKSLEEVDIVSTPLHKIENRPNGVHREYWLRKAERPDYETLLNEVETMGFVGTGKKYGVSDNAVRKWIKFYENQMELR